MKEDNGADYLGAVAGLVFLVAGLVFGALWVACKLIRLVFRFAWWLCGGRWLARRLLREFRDYWAWRSGADWKLERNLRQVEREWEYVRRDVPWDQLRPGFRSLGARIGGWFRDRSFPAWVRARLTTKAGKNLAKKEAV